MTPVVIAFTPNYIVPAATLVQSVLKYSEGSFEFICLTEQDIPSDRKRMLENMTGNRAVWRYLEIKELPEGVYVDPRYGEAAEYRLLLPELLPEYEKIIYVDCDVIVRNDLKKLFSETNLGDKLLAAVFEAPIENQAEEWDRMGCDPGKYFNSGFLIINLEQMRKEKTSEKLIRTLQGGSFEFPDQDALNLVCKGRVLALPPFYNSIRTFWLPQYKKDFLKVYSESDWKEIHCHGSVHYTGGKPWNILSVQYDIWWKAYYSLPTNVRMLWTPSGKQKIIAKIYLSQIGKAAIEGCRNTIRIMKGLI